MQNGHGGNIWNLAKQAGCTSSELLDFSANINPLGPPNWLRPVISAEIESLVHYPDPAAAELVAALAAAFKLAPEQIVVGNGSSELLFALPQIAGKRRAIIPVPSYIDYARAASAAGLEVITPHLAADQGFQPDWHELDQLLDADSMLIVGQPNNPTGTLLEPQQLRRLIQRHQDSLFVIDEAFADFLDAYESLLPNLAANVVVSRSLTKFYAIPGLRLGFLAAPAPLAAQLRQRLAPWSVNTLAQAVGIAAIADTDYAAASRLAVTAWREQLTSQLQALPGVQVFAGCANYLLLRLDPSLGDAASLGARLLEQHISIRDCRNYAGLDPYYLRVAVRTPAENNRLLAAMTAILAPSARRIPGRKVRAAAAIMFQGTSSNAGKSVLTAALCRILLQDGVRVAPFKAQNMSLNSFVTRDGGEMGRAQVVQAQACRLEPDVRMNPILLKPNSHTGSQVIVRGKPVGNMSVREYMHYKSTVWENICRTYDELAGEYTAIVLEGAGSPAEVNLKAHDIVNMRMAAHAQAPVLLVGDIDRGGVYASFVGSMEVLETWERQLIRGFIVNRFRGDASLLSIAHEYVLRHTRRPVLGVVPYLPDLGLPEEDSVEFKSGALDKGNLCSEAVDIAVIDLPHISNFTDLDALRIEPDVRLHIVRRLTDMPAAPAAVLLPGSKNVLADLRYLRDSGIAQRIPVLLAAGSEIIGICGGFQMLGRLISDPHQLESTSGEAAGLSLLDIETVLAPAKTLLRTQARHLASGHLVSGYEIHHGQSRAGSATVLFIDADDQAVGIGRDDQTVWGTYLHGVFDADAFRRDFIDRLRCRRGLPPIGSIVATYDIEAALDRLADIVRANLDMPEIYALLDL